MRAYAQLHGLVYTLKGHKSGWFYCPLILENDYYSSKWFSYEFDVMEYILGILNNIAIDSGNKITKCSSRAFNELQIYVCTSTVYALNGFVWVSFW